MSQPPSTTLPPFDGNTYRKRVLSAVDARGGPEQSDPFELYDLPLERAESLTDAEVAERIDTVWAFWQKQRDHPKYRGAVTAMLDIHRRIADQLRTTDGRRWLADRSREARAERDAARFAELDAALSRLVERFGGIPADKVDGLRRFAAAAGVDEESFTQRLRRQRLLPASAAVPVVDDTRFRQVRDDLEELGQLDGTPPPTSLYVLLALPPTATRDEVRRRREELSARNRELRPDRRRALVDDLLAAVDSLLVNSDPGRYLDDLRAGVLARLRPRVAAAVLVEDVLTAQDHEHLLREARAGGLDLDRARAVLAQLAGELGVPVQTDPGRSTETRRPTAPAPAAPEQHRGGWQEALSQARAALRAGAPRTAVAHLGAAQAAAGMMLPPIRAVRDEVDEILAEADQRWRVAVAAVGSRRYAEAVVVLQRLTTIARDVPGPRGESGQQLLTEARATTATADAACVAAMGQAGAARELALLDVLDVVVDHEDAQRELAAIGVAPARVVRAAPGDGAAVVSWQASSSPGPVDYRVLRLLADGQSRPVGVTRGTSLEDGAPGAAVGYAVVARRSGIAAPEARTDRPDPAPALPVELPPVVERLSLVPMGRRIRLTYPVPASGHGEVRRLAPGVPAPAPGTRMEPGQCGVLVPGMGPGLAVDSRPAGQLTEYVVLTVDAGAAVVGAAAAYVDLPPVTDLRVEQGRLRWTWPPGCTEVSVVTRSDAPPDGAADPAATARKVTNTRYEIEGGMPVDGASHVAVFTCTRVAGQLYVSTEAPPPARRSPA